MKTTLNHHFITVNTFKFDASRNLLRNGKGNSMAPSKFGAKYIVTANLYNDGRFTQMCA